MVEHRLVAMHARVVQQIARFGRAHGRMNEKQIVGAMDDFESGKINNHAAKEVFVAVAQTGANPADIVKEKGLEQVSDESQIIEIANRETSYEKKAEVFLKLIKE